MEYDSLTELTYYRGRVAMAAILRALGVGRGDEVVIQAFTCVAVPEAVLACGATPVYADLESEGFNAGPEQIACKLTDATRAIVVQHTFGVPARIQELIALAQERGIAVIEDCCHVDRTSGSQLGRYGDAAFYSFEWGKPTIVGVGGAAVANTPELAAKLSEHQQQLVRPSIAASLRNEVQYRAFRLLYRPRLYWPVKRAFRKLSSLRVAEGNFHAPSGGEVSPEFAMRMSGLSERKLVSKLRVAERAARHRLRVTERYADAFGEAASSLAELPLARFPLRVYHKAELLRRAEAAGVELAEWYSTPIHPLDADGQRAVGYEPGCCPEAEQRSAEIVSLPTHAGVDDRFIDQAIELLHDAVISKSCLQGKEAA